MSGLVHESRLAGTVVWPFPVRIPLKFESLVFVVVSGLDFLITYLLIDGTWLGIRDRVIYTESNPFARYFLYSWGFFGLVTFKLVLMGVVETACQLIARERPLLGSRVLNLCTGIVGVVVVYSIGLMLANGG